MQENRSGAAGTAFRRLRNGREVYPDEQGSAPLRPIQPCKNYRNSGGSGNITPLPPLLLPPANTLIHNEIMQKVAEVVIKLKKISRWSLMGGCFCLLMTTEIGATGYRKCLQVQNYG
jgi:hypothetical protein